LVFKRKNESPNSNKQSDEIREKIAKRACQEITDSMFVNLGIGIPTLVPEFLAPGNKTIFHSENGVIGVSSYPDEGQQDPDLINAGRETITVNKGASFLSSSQSFGIVRGSHLDLTILGGMQVSQSGDLANWIIPGKMVKGMGGAMDLVASGSKVLVVMEHQAKGQHHKILDKCSLPLTGKGVVNKLITEKVSYLNLKSEEKKKGSF